MTMRKVEPKSSDDMIGPSRSDEPRKYYPNLHMELKQLPEAKKWEIGKEYTVTLKLKMTGLSISRFQNCADFDIVGIDPEVEADEE